MTFAFTVKPRFPLYAGYYDLRRRKARTDLVGIAVREPILTLRSFLSSKSRRIVDFDTDKSLAVSFIDNICSPSIDAGLLLGISFGGMIVVPPANARYSVTPEIVAKIKFEPTEHPQYIRCSKLRNGLL